MFLNDFFKIFVYLFVLPLIYLVSLAPGMPVLLFLT